MTITYTNESTERIVKPTQTIFTNETDKDITLNFKNGSSEVIRKNNSSNKLSTTIKNINYGSKFYYSSDDDYTIPTNKTVTLEKSGSNIDMNIL